MDQEPKISADIDQLHSDLVKTTTTTTMDEDTTTSSSGSDVPTPTSSTPAPKTEILVHAPECEMAIESKENCPDGGNCADCQLNQLHSHAEYWSLRADCTCGKDNDDSTSASMDAWARPQLRLPSLDELMVGDIMEPGTLEAARQHVSWLAGEIDEAMERATKNLSAGMRPRHDDAWVINEAGTLLSRLVPHMGSPAGAFSLDHGQVYSIPDAVWPLPAPPIQAGEMNHSGMARRKMEVFSSRVRSQLEARKEEQRRSSRLLVGDWLKRHPTTTTTTKTTKAAPESAPPSTQGQQKAAPEPTEVHSPTKDISPRLQRQLDLNEKKSLRRIGPLVVNGSTPYPKKMTATTTELATHAPSATHVPEKQPNPELPSAQTPAEDFSSFIEKQIDLIEHEKLRRTQNPFENKTLPNQLLKYAVTRPASQLTDTSGHQYPPQQQHQQPLNSNPDFYPTPDIPEPIVPARGQVLPFPPAALPQPNPHNFVQGGYAFEPNPPITGPHQIPGAPVHQAPENAGPSSEQAESPSAPRRVNRPLIKGLMLSPPPPPPPPHAHHDPLQVRPLILPTIRISDERSPSSMLPTFPPQPQPAPQHLEGDLEAHRLLHLKWSWARENQFWTPPGGDVRAYAHVCAEFLGLPPPSDHHIFGHEHGHLCFDLDHA